MKKTENRENSEKWRKENKHLSEFFTISTDT